MSVDRTLHMKSGIASKRNVLKRDERIATMAEAGSFDLEKDNPLGIPKTRVKHSRAGHKAKKEEKPAEGAEGAAAAAAPAAEAAKPAKSAKPGKEAKK